MGTYLQIVKGGGGVGIEEDWGRQLTGSFCFGLLPKADQRKSKGNVRRGHMFAAT